MPQSVARELGRLTERSIDDARRQEANRQDAARNVEEFIALMRRQGIEPAELTCRRRVVKRTLLGKRYDSVEETLPYRGWVVASIHGYRADVNVIALPDGRRIDSVRLGEAEPAPDVLVDICAQSRLVAEQAERIIKSGDPLRTARQG